MATSVLLVEDDESLNRAISRKLEKEGYEVYPSFLLQEAADLCRRYPIGLIICDIGLPDGSGLDFCREARKYGNAIFLFLTALDTETDVLRGYDVGADDYITKPFSLDVLVSKVNALMKRYGTEEEPRCVISGSIVYFADNRVEKDGVQLNLTANEQKLLLYFMENPGEFFQKISCFHLYGTLTAILLMKILWR